MKTSTYMVIGAGPSGNAAAYTAAKAGLNVLQIERGESPGSKNVQGAILYSDALEKIIPDFRDDAPLERHLIEQRMWMLDDESYVGSTYRSKAFNTPPYNRYTIIRAQFDKWFSKKVQEAGALTICETTVPGLHMDGDRVVGVETDRAGGSVYADAVILADGVNSLLAKKGGFSPRTAAARRRARRQGNSFPAGHDDREPLQRRAGGRGRHRDGRQDHAGHGRHGVFVHQHGVADHRRRLPAVGSCAPRRSRPHALIEKMKAHPAIRPLLEGGEMKEYCAHLIPEGGYNAIPTIYGAGWMMVGDAGMFVNSVHREGSNLAMTTGRLAAETLIELRAAGKDFTAANLARYRSKLDESFVMKDLKKYRDMPGFLEKNPQFFTQYPGAHQPCRTYDAAGGRRGQEEQGARHPPEFHPETVAVRFDR